MSKLISDRAIERIAQLCVTACTAPNLEERMQQILCTLRTAVEAAENGFVTVKPIAWPTVPDKGMYVVYEQLDIALPGWHAVTGDRNFAVKSAIERLGVCRKDYLASNQELETLRSNCRSVAEVLNRLSPGWRQHIGLAGFSDCAVTAIKKLSGEGYKYAGQVLERTDGTLAAWSQVTGAFNISSTSTDYKVKKFYLRED